VSISSGNPSSKIGAPGGDAGGADLGARLMLVTLCFIWGTTWPLMKVALNEIPPLSMRAVAAALGALTLYLLCVAMRRSLRVPSAKAFGHIVVASTLNITGFSLFSAFAQLAASTSRVTIIAYTMPVWSVLLAWPFLGERPSRAQWIALILCAIGLSILIYPLTGSGVPLGLVLALGVGLSWAAGTVYVKWAHIELDSMALASWQMTIAFVALTACMFIVDGHLELRGLSAEGAFATVWTGVVGNGVAYALWFPVVKRLPAVTASLGVLAVPVVGIVQSFLILGEVPTTPDMIGFALIFAASACVLLTPNKVSVAATP
jgi:drug/metabolite transporter (DMT)-like permease